MIDFIRHGEPQGGRKFRGWGVDDPLNELGWRQMWEAVGEHSHWQQIVTSPLVRCRAFAEALGEKNSVNVSVDNNLEEVGFGEWEGKTPKEIIASNKAQYDAFYADPVNNRPAGSEDLDLFSARVASAYQNIISLYAGQSILVVAHAGVIRAAIAYVLKAPVASIYTLEIDNAGLSRIRISDGKTKLEFVNRARLAD